jgi:hypothetical protein
MRRIFIFGTVICGFACAELFEAAGQSEDKRMVQAYVAKEKEEKPAKTFVADVANIYLIWKGERLQAGDEIRAVWIAEDVGDAAPKETKIGERSVTVYKPDEGGAISLSRPGGRVWPVGRYRTEIYIGKELLQAVRFAIEPGVRVEVH